MDRQIEAIFCDDIRHEINGKSSFIGCYGTEMWVADFPATLPKFCVAYWVRILHARPITGLTVKIMKDFDPIWEETVEDLPNPLDYPAVQQTIAEGREGGATFHSSVAFTPLVLEEPCTIRIRAYTSDGEELKAFALRVNKPPTESSIQPE